METIVSSDNSIFTGFPCGKFIWRRLLEDDGLVTVNGPLNVWKVSVVLDSWEDLAISVSVNKMWAVAKVAWPHKLTSTWGVNQRRLKSRDEESRRDTNAVSDRFISLAILARVESFGIGPSKKRQTAAGLP